MAAQYVLAIIGTMLCGLGFVQRPKSSYELLRPKFVVPFAIWMATFVQVLIHQLDDRPRYIVYANALQNYSSLALAYASACVALFWVGYVLPIGRMLSRPLLHLREDLPVNPERYRVVGIACAVLVCFATWFMRTEAGWIIVTQGIGAALIHSLFFLGPIGAGIIGFAWPAKGRRNLFNVGISIFALILLTLPQMAKFSRGTGLPMLVALAAYSIRMRQVKLWLTALLLGVAFLLAHAGLYGRMVYGHYAGAMPYLHTLFTESIFSWREALVYASGASDSLTSLCTSMQGSSVSYIGRLSVSDWLQFQIPIPRVFGIHPDWTLELARHTGGHRTTAVTPGMLGDTYIHLGFVGGALMFSLVGALYRFVDALAFEHDERPADAAGLNPFLVLAFSSYYAMAVGLFNNFRAWNVAFSLPLYGLIALLIMRRLLRPASSASVALAPSV